VVRLPDAFSGVWVWAAFIPFNEPPSRPGRPAEARPNWFQGASFRMTITSEYLGVGYIIGSRVSGILFAGGIISWLVIIAGDPLLRPARQQCPHLSVHHSNSAHEPRPDLGTTFAPWAQALSASRWFDHSAAHSPHNISPRLKPALKMFALKACLPATPPPSP